METRHPVEGSFRSEFTAICNHCVVIFGVLKLQYEILWAIFAVFKTTPYGKNVIILFRKFTWRHRSTLLCSNFVKFGRREIWNSGPEKNFACLSNCLYCADRAQNLPEPAPNNVGLLRVLQISSKSVHVGRVLAERVNTAKLSHKVNPKFGRSVTLSRITSKTAQQQSQSQ